jgi:hypothetical protein
LVVRPNWHVIAANPVSPRLLDPIARLGAGARFPTNAAARPWIVSWGESSPRVSARCASGSVLSGSPPQFRLPGGSKIAPKVLPVRVGHSAMRWRAPQPLGYL